MIPLLIINKIILYIIMNLLGGGINKKDTIVIYPGRFQPFHKGHHDVYRFLKEKYDNVFIVTTDTKSKDKKRYPFNFAQKVDIMKKLGRVEENDIYPEPVSNPYSDYYIIKYIRYLKSISESLSPDLKKRINDINLQNALVLFAISDKDMSPTDGTKPRFSFPNNNLAYTKKTNSRGNPIPAKIQKIKSRKHFKNTTFNNIRSNTNTKYNYVLTVPTNVFNVLGENINSATQLRNMIIEPPEGYSNINVLESLYDLKVDSSNVKLIDFIIKTIKKAYGINSPRRNSQLTSTLTSTLTSEPTFKPSSKSASVLSKPNSRKKFSKSPSPSPSVSKSPSGSASKSPSGSASKSPSGSASKSPPRKRNSTKSKNTSNQTLRRSARLRK
jgi:cytidyltransferase-like protein